MHRKEISIIIRTAEGITRALNELAHGDDALADAGYYAIMWLEQQRREEQRDV